MPPTEKHKQLHRPEGLHHRLQGRLVRLEQSGGAPRKGRPLLQRHEGRSHRQGGVHREKGRLPLLHRETQKGIRRQTEAMEQPEVRQNTRGTAVEDKIKGVKN